MFDPYHHHDKLDVIRQTRHTVSMLIHKQGFTLIELLIVMTILGILSTVGFANFQNSRIKAKDIARKTDLQTIAKSLEAYANDYRAYPNSSNGKIQVNGSSINWGSSFQDANTTYITRPKRLRLFLWKIWIWILYLCIPRKFPRPSYIVILRQKLW